MKILIMGCGRVGARLATMLDEDKHEVTILDSDTYSFRVTSFLGGRLFWERHDSEALKRAGMVEADISWRSPSATTLTSWRAR
jgi:trk system potassium uptake protein TrkA